MFDNTIILNYKKKYGYYNLTNFILINDLSNIVKDILLTNNSFSDDTKKRLVDYIKSNEPFYLNKFLNINIRNKLYETKTETESYTETSYNDYLEKEELQLEEEELQLEEEELQLEEEKLQLEEEKLQLEEEKRKSVKRYDYSNDDMIINMFFNYFMNCRDVDIKHKILYIDYIYNNDYNSFLTDIFIGAFYIYSSIRLDYNEYKSIYEKHILYNTKSHEEKTIHELFNKYNKKRIIVNTMNILAHIYKGTYTENNEFSEFTYYFRKNEVGLKHSDLYDLTYINDIINSDNINPIGKLFYELVLYYD